jgi:lysophospholipase L1-like esterase
MRKLTACGALVPTVLAFLALLLTASSPARASSAPIPYTALGDSYSAGEGNDPFDSDCHRALHADSAYPRILPSLVPYISAPNFHACTGAVTADVWRRPQPERQGQGIQTSYLHRSDRLVTLTIGGNDLRFSPILRECLLSFNCAESDLAGEVEAELAKIQPRLVDVYKQVRSRMSPTGYLVVAGYPRLFSLGPDAGCNPLISPTESAWVDRLIDRGNARIAAAVRSARRRSGNVFYVDVAGGFAGHELCSSDPWLYTLRLSFHEGRNLVQGSYHPTRKGQAAYAGAIAGFLRRPAVRAALTASRSPRSAYSASSPGPGS